MVSETNVFPSHAFVIRSLVLRMLKLLKLRIVAQFSPDLKHTKVVEC